jgi:hypothetical protein
MAGTGTAGGFAALAAGRVRPKRSPDGIRQSTKPGPKQNRNPASQETANEIRTH